MTLGSIVFAPDLRPVTVDLSRAATDAAAYWGARVRANLRDMRKADRLGCAGSANDYEAAAYECARAAGTAARLARS